MDKSAAEAQASQHYQIKIQETDDYSNTFLSPTQQHSMNFHDNQENLGGINGQIVVTNGQQSKKDILRTQSTHKVSFDSDTPLYGDQPTDYPKNTTGGNQWSSSNGTAAQQMVVRDLNFIPNSMANTYNQQPFSKAFEGNSLYAKQQHRYLSPQTEGNFLPRNSGELCTATSGGGQQVKIRRGWIKGGIKALQTQVTQMLSYAENMQQETPQSPKQHLQYMGMDINRSTSLQLSGLQQESSMQNIISKQMDEFTLTQTPQVSNNPRQSNQRGEADDLLMNIVEHEQIYAHQEGKFKALPNADQQLISSNTSPAKTLSGQQSHQQAPFQPTNARFSGLSITSASALNTAEIKVFRLLSQDPSPLIQKELSEQLAVIPLSTLLTLHNTTGYSLLHVATSNNQSAYGMLVLNTVVEKMNVELQRQAQKCVQKNQFFQILLIQLL